MTGNNRGLISALLCFGLWGVLPIYWKHLDFMHPVSLVAQRTIWTCLAMWPLLWWRGIGVKGDFRTISWHFLSGLLIGGNWLLYVWAVVSEQMIEGALGYYINPFFNMLFGLIWFGEKQNRLQLIAIAVAFCGVLMQIPGVGHFPWLALSIALTFSFYGVVRKRSPLGAIDGLTVETSALVPIALGWLVYHNSSVSGAFGGSWENTLWLAGTGVITAFPLLFFGYASRTIRLSTLGMLQFIGPTIQFFIGWKMYGEPMSTSRLLSFGLIWLAIGLYAFNAISRSKNERQPMLAEEASGG